MRVSQATAQIVQDRLPIGLELVEVGERELRGLSGPEPVFELRPLAAASRPSVAAAPAAVRKTVTVPSPRLAIAASPGCELDPEVRGRVLSRCLSLC